MLSYARILGPFIILGCLAANAQAAVCSGKRNMLGTMTTFAHGQYIDTLAWSRNGDALAVIDSLENQLYVWDIASKKLRFKTKISAGALHGLAFSADGKALLSVNSNAEVARAFSVFDAFNGKLIRDVPGPNDGLGNNHAALIALNQVGTRVAVVHASKPYYSIYDASTWTLEKTVLYSRKRSIYAADIMPSGDVIWFAGHSGFHDEIEFYNFPGDGLKFSARITSINKGTLNFAAVSSDGATMGLAAYLDDVQGYRLEIRNVADWQLKQSIATTDIKQLSYQANGDLIAAIGVDHKRAKVQLFSASHGALLDSWLTSDPSSVVAFNPTGTLLAYGDGSRVHICNVKQ